MYQLLCSCPPQTIANYKPAPQHKRQTIQKKRVRGCQVSFLWRKLSPLPIPSIHKKKEVKWWERDSHKQKSWTYSRENINELLKVSVTREKAETRKELKHWSRYFNFKPPRIFLRFLIPKHRKTNFHFRKQNQQNLWNFFSLIFIQQTQRLLFASWATESFQSKLLLVLLILLAQSTKIWWKLTKIELWIKVFRQQCSNATSKVKKWKSET